MAKKIKSKLTFAKERSNAASKVAYDLCKVTAQSCMLINGGAATAIIAILSKETIEATLSEAIPWALSGYAFGILFSALMLFCVMMMADNWNYSWYHESVTKDLEYADKSEMHANIWHCAMYACFAFAIIGFMFGSGALANSLFKSTSLPAIILPVKK